MTNALKYALRPLVLGVLSLASFAHPAAAQAPPKLEGNGVVLAYGEPKGPHARVTFKKNRAATAALKIETMLAGVAGSKVSIFIDKDEKPVFIHTLTGDECRFNDQGSICTIALEGRVAAYGRVIDGFRKGRISRLQVETGGVMAMSCTVSLLGFNEAIGKPQN